MAEMTQEQVAEMRKECTPNITTGTRQVSGGYIVSGRIVWVKPDGTPMGVQQDEAVCDTHNELGGLIEYYHRFFVFNKPAVPAN